MIGVFTRFDLANLLATPARVLLPMGFVVAMSLIAPSPLLAVPAAAAAVSLGVGTPFLNDERGRLDTLYATSPISRTTVVVGRYLSLVSWYAAAAALATVAVILIETVRGRSIDGSALLLVHAGSFLAVSLALAVQLPIFFGLGFTRARSMMFVPVIVLAVIATLAGGLEFDALALAPSDLPVLGVSAAAGGVVLILASAIVATRVYARRQL